MGRSSSKREEIYAFLKDYIASHGYPPTTREIMAGVGLRSTASVHYHLSELSRSGRHRDGRRQEPRHFARG